MKAVVKFLIIAIFVSLFLMLNYAFANMAYSTAGLPGPDKNPRVVERYSPRSHFFYYNGFYHSGRSYRGSGSINHK